MQKCLCITYIITNIAPREGEILQMKNYTRLFMWTMSALLTISLLASCRQGKKKYVIGVSQCSEDSWRKKLAEELDLATYFYDDVSVELRLANDNVNQQRAQIKELIDKDVDLLIVSPQKRDSLSDAISKATEKGIPVVLFDRVNEMKEFTAFMGASNNTVGRLVADYVAEELGGKGCIVEIAGERGSSPAEERHKGFRDQLKKYPGLKVVGYEEGNWKQSSGERSMKRILKSYDGRIDCVFGANDRMTLGARKVMEEYKNAHKDWQVNPEKTVYVGVDALPTPGGGLQDVKDGRLTASVIYPTNGGALMALAVSILRGESYEKINKMETTIVTAENVNLLQLQYKEIEQQNSHIKAMRSRIDSTMTELQKERLVMWCIILMVVVVCASLAFTVRMLRTKHRLNETLRRNINELNQEKETAERQRDELEEQRDRFLDATTKKQTDEEAIEDGPMPRNEFISHFYECLDRRIGDSDLSVEDIGNEMCLSRVQLYRKVKALTGRTPVEIVREERLKRADKMMKDTSLSVSEIAYRVGFSSPSYFSKCYKDFYGRPPSARKE